MVEQGREVEVQVQAELAVEGLVELELELVPVLLEVEGQVRLAECFRFPQPRVQPHQGGRPVC